MVRSDLSLSKRKTGFREDSPPQPLKSGPTDQILGYEKTYVICDYNHSSFISDHSNDKITINNSMIINDTESNNDNSISIEIINLK